MQVNLVKINRKPVKKNSSTWVSEIGIGRVSVTNQPVLKVGI